MKIAIAEGDEGFKNGFNDRKYNKEDYTHK